MKNNKNSLQIIVEQGKNAKTGGSIVGLNLAEDLSKKINTKIFVLDENRRTFKLLGERVINPFKISDTIKSLDKNGIVLFNYYFDLAAMILLIVSYLRGNKNIIAFHTFFKKGNNLVDFFYSIKKFFLLNFSLCLGKKIIFLTESQSNHFRKLSVVKSLFDSKSIVIPNGISNEKILKSKPRQSGLNLIFVGRLVKQKGAKELLQLSNTQNLFSRFIIIGKGNDFYESNLKNNSLIEYYKSVDYAHINSFYDKSTVLILPSYSEVFPLVILEAMARGLVVIVSDIPGMREIVKDGRNGFLFKKGDASELIDIINYLKNNPKVLSRMSKNNLIDIKKFTNDKQTAKYYDLYNEVRKLN